jgi:hypothetical protein
MKYSREFPNIRVDVWYLSTEIEDFVRVPNNEFHYRNEADKLYFWNAGGENIFTGFGRIIKYTVDDQGNTTDLYEIYEG